MTYGEWLVAGAKPDTPANYAAYVATLDGGMSRAAPPPPPAPLPAAGPPLPPPPLPAGSLTEAGAAANEAVAAKARETAAPFFRGARNLGDTALNWVGLGGVSKALGVRPEPVAKPSMPEEAAPQETKADPLPNYGPPLYLPEEPKGGGAARGAPIPIAQIGIQGRTSKLSPEAEKLHKQASETALLANSYGLHAQADADKERHAVEALIGTNQAAYDQEAKRLEERRVAAYEAFQQRIEDKKAEARAQAPARAISSLFSAVALAMGSYGASMTRSPNFALDLYKHAADEEARRLERGARDENNLYHRMVQEFGDKKQALAMTKIAFLEQGKAAFEKQAANTKSDFTRKVLLDERSKLIELQAREAQAAHERMGGPESFAINRTVYAGEDTKGVGRDLADTSHGIARGIEPQGKAEVPAVAAPAPAAVDDTPLGRLKTLWEKRKARWEKRVEDPAAVGARAGEAVREAGSGFVKRLGSLFEDDSPAPRTAQVKQALPAARAALVTPAPRPGVPLAKDGLPLIAADGLPRMSHKEGKEAEEALKVWLSNAGNQKLVEDRSRIYAFENRFNVFSQAQWAKYDAKKARDFLDREAVATKSRQTKGLLGGQVGVRLGAMGSNSVEDDLLKESPEFRQMYTAHRAMVQGDVVKNAGKTLTDNEEVLEQLSGVMRSDPRLFIQAYHMKIRDPFELQWKARTSTWTPAVKRTWDASMGKTYSAATGAEVRRGGPLGTADREAVTASGEERLPK